MTRSTIVRGGLAALAACALAACSPLATQMAPEAPPALPPGLTSARFVLLGEVHDNPWHHAWRARWLRELLADGRPTRVVFEQMDRSRDAELQRARLATPSDSAAIARAGGLDEKAWRWPLHAPLFDAALAGNAALAGGNVPRDTLRRAMREGPASAPPELAPLIDARGWTTALQQATEADIEASHCGALPASQFGPMALAQRLRDASLARAMLDAPPGSRVILIAGNGHVRSDRGVPHYLRAAGVPAADIRAIGFVEAGDAPSPGVYDAIEVAPRAERPDPCEAFARPR